MLFVAAALLSTKQGLPSPPPSLFHQKLRPGTHSAKLEAASAESSFPLLYPPSASVGKQEEEDEVGITSPGNPEKQSHFAHTCKKPNKIAAKCLHPLLKRQNWPLFTEANFSTLMYPQKDGEGRGRKRRRQRDVPFEAMAPQRYVKSMVLLVVKVSGSGNLRLKPRLAAWSLV